MSPPQSFDEQDVHSRMSDIRARIDALEQRIQAAGGGVEVLAVTKGHPIEAVVAAQRLDLGQLGENYAQELAAKAAVLESAGLPQPRWHFIGQLQRNKVRLIADLVAVWQSVDRLRVGREIARHAPNATVFVQVNLSEEHHKGGCAFVDVDDLVADLDGLGLRVDGLMGVGTAANDAQTAAGFARLRAAVDRLSLRHCSMGMSDDLELAIKNGSTMVRIGTDLFGPRR